MSSKEQIRITAERLTHELPYSNVPKLFLANGKKPPEGWGGNCIANIRSWASEMAKIGAKSTYLQAYSPDEDDEGPYLGLSDHRALLVENESGLFFYDTIVMLSTPIPIRDILKETGSHGETGIVYDAMPIVEGHPTHVIVKPESETTFTIVVESYKKNGYKPVIELFYDLNEANDELPSDDDVEIASNISDGHYFVRFRSGDGQVLLTFNSENGDLALSKAGDGFDRKTWFHDHDTFLEAAKEHLPVDINVALQTLWECPELDQLVKTRWEIESSE